MPAVNTQHKLYKRLLPRWKMVRDAVEGEYAVKAAADAYLPKLLGAKESVYQAYIQRALFFEATRRTLQGLVGMVMQKAPQIEAKEDVQEVFLKDLTKDGMSLNGFSAVVLREVLMLNKYGILCDLPARISKDSEPFLVGYTAESIINWEFANIAGKSYPTRIVLEEEYEVEDPEDRFKVECKQQYRVLELVDRNGVTARDESTIIPKIDPGMKSIYRVQVWRKKKDLDKKSVTHQDEFEMHEEHFPSYLGTAMDRIPFIVVTAEDEDKEDQKPPLESIASVNMSHYRSSADLEHGRHFTALPTPYVIGLSEQQELFIGSQTVWVISGVNASEVAIGMLEFTGQGLKALETAMTEKESQMARLGARLLEDQKKAVESFETHKIKSAGEQSILAAVANGVSEGMNEALEWMTTWDKTLGEMTMILNTDYVKAVMEPTMLTALVGALQGGRISFKTFYFNMQKAGMYPEDHTEETELELIELEQPEPMNLDDEGEEEEEEEEVQDEDDEGNNATGAAA